MNEKLEDYFLIRLFTALKLCQMRNYLNDYNERRYLYEENLNDYGDKLKPILKEAHIVYVCPNSYYSDSTNASNTNILNIHKLKYEYNLKPMDLYKECNMTLMFFNNSDLKRGYSLYPYSFKELVKLYRKMNVEANVYLIRTKYSSWDEDFDGKELFEEYEGREFNKPHNYSHNYYYSRNYYVNPIWKEMDLGKLESYISIPLKYLRHCGAYFIAIKANNGLTCITKVFSTLYQSYDKKDEKLGILSRVRSISGFEYHYYNEDSRNNSNITKDLTTSDDFKNEKDPTNSSNTSNKMKNKKKKNNKKKNNKKKNNKKKNKKKRN